MQTVQNYIRFQNSQILSIKGQGRGELKKQDYVAYFSIVLDTKE